MISVRVYFSPLLDYELVASDAACSGRATRGGYFENVEKCANSCRGTSEMFTFDTKKKKKQCDTDGICECWCKLTTTNSRCEQQVGGSYELYAFRGNESKKCICFFYDVF